MTNGEKLKEIFPYLKSDKTDLVKVLNIDNLKSWWNAEYKEPTTKNDLGVDCISRAEVLKLMQDNWHTHNGDWAMQESMDDIRALPSVTPIRPKGHWIKGYTLPDGKYWKCDKCKELIKVKYPMYYCNNCGSDNREVVEE